jgi:hypothetical protein
VPGALRQAASMLLMVRSGGITRSADKRSYVHFIEVSCTFRSVPYEAPGHPQTPYRSVLRNVPWLTSRQRGQAFGARLPCTREASILLWSLLDLAHEQRGSAAT